MPLNAAILGYYGFGNLGDEAVLAGIRQALSEVAETELRVLSANPEETRRLHPGVQAISRWKWRPVAETLRGLDLFILGGGSLLQDATSVKSVLWYTFMALIARRRVRRVLWWGQGVGPLSSPLSRLAVRLIANQADVLTVRDTDSSTLLKAIGAHGSIKVVADPAFALRDDVTTQGSANVLLALRDWKDGSVARALTGTDVVGQLSTVFPAGSQDAVAGLPMHLPQDREMMRMVLGGPVPLWDWLAQGDTIASVVGRVATVRLVIAMRLHALIFAARSAVPFVALSYDPKVTALAKSAGQEDLLLPLNEVSVQRLRELSEMVRDSEAERRERLREFARKQGELARIPAKLSVE